MTNKEATARIKINKLLEAAGWRFFDEECRPANICLEPTVKIKVNELDAMGNDFEKTRDGFIDFLLLDPRGFPFFALEVKAECKDPLSSLVKGRNHNAGALFFKFPRKMKEAYYR